MTSEQFGILMKVLRHLVGLIFAVAVASVAIVITVTLYIHNHDVVGAIFMTVLLVVPGSMGAIAYMMAIASLVDAAVPRDNSASV